MITVEFNFEFLGGGVGSSMSTARLGHPWAHDEPEPRRRPGMMSIGQVSKEVVTSSWRLQRRQCQESVAKARSHSGLA